MTKFLDLRKKVEPRVKIIYKTVTAHRPWHVELTKIIAVVFVVGVVVWGVSRADDNVGKKDAAPAEIKTFSVLGIVSSAADTELSLDKISGKDGDADTSLTFDVKSLQKIETSEYAPLQFSDIRTGDKIIVQGTIENGVTIARRIVSFTPISISTTTATSTEALISTSTDMATTTDIASTSTDMIASSTASTTPSFIDNVVEAVADAVQDVIDTIADAITGTTTSDATTTTEIMTVEEEAATSTVASQVEQDVPDVTVTETINNATSTE